MRVSSLASRIIRREFFKRGSRSTDPVGCVGWVAWVVLVALLGLCGLFFMCELFVMMGHDHVSLSTLSITAVG